MKTETIWGECWIRPIATCIQSKWILGEFFQVNEKGEFTLRGNHYIPSSMIQNESSAPNISRMVCVSGDMFDATHHETKVKASFPIHKKVGDYDGPEFKVFAQVWVKSETVEQVAKNLGIPTRKAHSVVKRLRGLGVRVPIKEDERNRPSKKKEQFNWVKFAKVIKGAYSMEFACNTLNMEVEDIIARCIFLQENKIPALIPAFDKTPEWLKIRMGRELMQLVYIGDGHGSGKNFKLRYAGYKRKAMTMARPNFSEMLAIFR